MKKQKISNKELIIKTAQDLFLTKGYHGTSVRDIANKAGVSLGGIYAHYENKENIYLELLKAKVPFIYLIDLIEKHKGESVPDFFKNIAKDWVAILDPRDIRILFIEWVEFAGSNAKKLVPILFQNKILKIKEIFGEKINKKELKPYDPLLIMRSFIQMLTIYIVTDDIFTGFTETKKPVDDVVDIFLYGVVSK